MQMLLKKGYTCSVATYGHLVEPDTTKTELKQREETKEHVVEASLTIRKIKIPLSLPRRIIRKQSQGTCWNQTSNG